MTGIIIRRIAAAVDHYGGQVTPNLLIVETRLSGREALEELDSLAEVCDPATKVVVVGRVNDVELEWMGQGAAHLLRVCEVEVGLRGAFRRVFKGLLPRATLEKLSRKFAFRGIPWEFVDVIEVDPARRVKLRIEYERLAEMHPSDLAEILEDLAPAEREAVFTSLDEEVAAEALEDLRVARDYIRLWKSV